MYCKSTVECEMNVKIILQIEANGHFLCINCRSHTSTRQSLLFFGSRRRLQAYQHILSFFLLSSSSSSLVGHPGYATLFWPNYVFFHPLLGFPGSWFLLCNPKFGTQLNSTVDINTNGRQHQWKTTGQSVSPQFAGFLGAKASLQITRVTN